MTIEAMKQMVEALEAYQHNGSVQLFDEAITTGRQAIAEAEKQEPVGEILMTNGDYKEVSWKRGKIPPVGTKLYTHPQQSTWVGLTDEERKELWDEWENGHVVEATEAKLKEKNT